MPGEGHAAADPGVGLCSVCAHATRQPNARGSVFWRCRAADGDARMLRYPPLPVTRCPAHVSGEPDDP